MGHPGGKDQHGASPAGRLARRSNAVLEDAAFVGLRRRQLNEHADLVVAMGRCQVDVLLETVPFVERRITIVPRRVMSKRQIFLFRSKVISSTFLTNQAMRSPLMRESIKICLPPFLSWSRFGTSFF